MADEREVDGRNEAQLRRIEARGQRSLAERTQYLVARNPNTAENRRERTFQLSDDWPLRPLVTTVQGTCMDCYAVSYYLGDAAAIQHLKLDFDWENFQMMSPASGAKRAKFISGVCAHIMQSQDEHRVCRSCEYLITKQLCKTTECIACGRMTSQARKQRRMRIPDTGCMKFELFGDAYEAARWYERYCFLEGVLWVLAASFRPDVNIGALRACRANIDRMTELQRGAAIYVSHQPCDQLAEQLQPVTSVKHRSAPTGRYIDKGIDAWRVDAAEVQLARLDEQLLQHTGDRAWMTSNRRARLPLELFVTPEGPDPYRAVRHRARMRGYASARGDRTPRIYRFHVSVLEEGRRQPRGHAG